MKTNTNNNLMQYIMNTLMTKIELDADVLSVACMMEGPIRKEDVVPEMMTNADWFAAKNYALSEDGLPKTPRDLQTEVPDTWRMTRPLNRWRR